MARKSNAPFIQGFGIAMADLIRLHDEPGMARDVIHGAGLRFADFEQAGLEEYDLEKLREALS